MKAVCPITQTAAISLRKPPPKTQALVRELSRLRQSLRGSFETLPRLMALTEECHAPKLPIHATPACARMAECKV